MTEKLIARIDFFESCVDQLKKDLPKYLKQQSDSNRTSTLLAKVLRNTASAEPNQQLQSCLFLHAQKVESIEAERDGFTECNRECGVQMEEAKTMLINPFREIIIDSALAKTKAIKQNDPRLAQETEHSLPIHTEFFEKHRIKSLKNLLKTVLKAELKFHCKAIEEISSILAAVNDIEETEEAE